MQTQQYNYYITAPGQIICLGALGIIGNLAAFILPVIVGGIVDHLGLDVQQAGYVATGEMLGLGVGAMVFSRYILQVNWRYFAFLAVAFVATANLLSPFTGGIHTLLPIRFLAGIGGGMLLAVGNSGMASTKTPERVLGACGIIAMLFAAAALYLFPLLLDAGGIITMFFAIAVLNLLLSLFIIGMPARSPYALALLAGAKPEPDRSAGGTKAAPDDERAPARISWLGLAGILFFFMAAMSFWAYFERVGAGAALSVDTIASVLGSSQLFGALGALTPVVLATRLGNRIVPLYASILLAALCAVLVASTSSVYLYAFAACGFIYSWAVFYPYIMAVMISLDPSAKLITYALGIQTLGKSAGPALGALLIVGSDFSQVYWFCVVCFIGSLLLLTPAIVYSDKKIQRRKILDPANMSTVPRSTQSVD